MRPKISYHQQVAERTLWNKLASRLFQLYFFEPALERENPEACRVRPDHPTFICLRYLICLMPALMQLDRMRKYSPSSPFNYLQGVKLRITENSLSNIGVYVLNLLHFSVVVAIVMDRRKQPP